MTPGDRRRLLSAPDRSFRRRAAGCALVLGLCLAAASPGHADPSLKVVDRTPFILALSDMGRPQVTTRTREPGQDGAYFTVSPVRLDREASLLFEIVSVGSGYEQVRWSCLAIEDTRECFARPQEHLYLPNDRALELRTHSISRMRALELARLAQH